MEGDKGNWTLEYSGEQNISSLHNTIAEEMGVPAQFLMIYKNNPPYQKNGLNMRMHESRRIDNLPQSTFQDVDLKNNSHLLTQLRPVKGDHIHQAYVIRIAGNQLKPLIDQRHFKGVDDAPYEDGSIADGVYQKTYLHTAVHTHLDNLIHIHPWSAPFWFHESEGLGANFGQFMQTVDLEYRQYPDQFSLEFSHPMVHELPGKKRFTNGEKIDGVPHYWQLVFWPDHRDPSKKTVYTKDFDRVWLNHNMGMITLEFAPKGAEIAPPPKEIIDFMMGGTFPMLKGFDGEEYPSLRRK